MMNCDIIKRTDAANFKILFTSFHGKFLYIKRTYEELIATIILQKDIQSRTTFSRCELLDVCQQSLEEN